MQYHAYGAWVYAHALLEIPMGSLKVYGPSLILAIDWFYRIEWFDLYTPAHAFLQFVFGGE
jgi:hypothetical protein